MTAELAVAPPPAGPATSDGWQQRLLGQVRPEFRRGVIMVAIGDPVMGFPACVVAGCPRPGMVRAMCTAHHQRWLGEGRPPLPGWVPTANPDIRGRTELQLCLVERCRRGVTSSGLCAGHRLRWIKAGRPPVNNWQQTADPVDRGKPACAVSGCPVLAESTIVPLCRVHGYRWRDAGRPALTDFSQRCATIGQLRFDFTGLATGIALEMQYVLQCKVDERTARATPQLFAPLLNELREVPETSLLDRSAGQWLARFGRAHRTYGTFAALIRYAIRCLQDLRDGTGWDTEYPRDVWQLRRLGLALTPGASAGELRFDDLPQPWLRELTKRYLRLRLTAGLAITTVQRYRNSIAALAAFVEQQTPGSRSAAALDRDLLERWLATAGEDRRRTRTYAGHLSAVRGFLDTVHRLGWAPLLPASAAVHPQDFPQRIALSARFLSEYVMAQLDSDTALDRIGNPQHQLAVRVIIGTGLRQGDARHLPVDCLVRDPQGAPYLRYLNRKMRREALVPITDDLADRISVQQSAVRQRYTAPTLLLPRTIGNLDGRLPMSGTALNTAVNQWLIAADVRDESGAPARVTPHQFRHTYATRLINQDVPLEVVRRLLDHSSLAMTAHYARLTDRTVREQWDKARKVDIHGQPVIVEPDSPLADAAWMKHNLGRAKMALPNGYCGLPLQQSCPHANACLDCPVFLTTPEFLPQHRQQLITTEALLARARADGHLRVVEMNQRVATNLERIIGALHDPQGEPQ